MEGGTQVSTSASYQFTLNGNRTLVAIFEADTPDGIEELNTEIAVYGSQGGVVIRNCVEKTHIEIYNLSGHLVINQTIEGENIIPLNRGLYIVRCMVKNKQMTTVKVVVR
jgi:hypothetical protein